MVGAALACAAGVLAGELESATCIVWCCCGAVQCGYACCESMLLVSSMTDRRPSGVSSALFCVRSAAVVLLLCAVRCVVSWSWLGEVVGCALCEGRIHSCSAAAASTMRVVAGRECTAACLSLLRSSRLCVSHWRLIALPRPISSLLFHPPDLLIQPPHFSSIRTLAVTVPSSAGYNIAVPAPSDGGSHSCTL